MLKQGIDIFAAEARSLVCRAHEPETTPEVLQVDDALPLSSSSSKRNFLLEKGFPYYNIGVLISASVIHAPNSRSNSLLHTNRGSFRDSKQLDI